MIVALTLALSPAFACPGEAKAATHASATTTHTSTASHSESGEKSSCSMPAATTVAALPADGTHASLNIAGMHCGSCADKVQVALMAVEGVKGARVDLAGNKAEIAYDPKKTNLDKLVAAVASNTTFTATVATN